jgi:hypothetical protein
VLVESVLEGGVVDPVVVVGVAEEVAVLDAGAASFGPQCVVVRLREGGRRITAIRP